MYIIIVVVDTYLEKLERSTVAEIIDEIENGKKSHFEIIYLLPHGHFERVTLIDSEALLSIIVIDSNNTVSIVWQLHSGSTRAL